MSTFGGASRGHLSDIAAFLFDRLRTFCRRTLLQAEVDRYHDTVILLRDYYRAMDGQVPDELTVDYARLPLLEVLCFLAYL